MSWAHNVYEFVAIYMETGRTSDLPDNHFIAGILVRGGSGQRMLSYNSRLAEPVCELVQGKEIDMGAITSEIH